MNGSPPSGSGALHPSPTAWGRSDYDNGHLCEAHGVRNSLGILADGQWYTSASAGKAPDRTSAAKAATAAVASSAMVA
jgi:hypothetical protein